MSSRHKLTPKAHGLIESLEKWCAERGIRPEEIPKFLECVVSRTRKLGYEKISWGEAYKELVEKGYLEEAEP